MSEVLATCPRLYNHPWAEPTNITPRSPYEPRWNETERALVRRYYGGQETFPAQPFPSAICHNCDEPIHAVFGGAGLWWVHGDGRAGCAWPQEVQHGCASAASCRHPRRHRHRLPASRVRQEGTLP